MKTKMITLWVSIAAIACLISFLVGKHYSEFSPETTRELENYVSQMKPLLADHDAKTKEELLLLIKILKALDASDDTQAKKEIIDRLGRYYYNYTYENERHMNSESTEFLLKMMESLSAGSPSFSSVLKFKPTE